MNTLKRLERCLLPPPEILSWNEGRVSIKKCSTIQKIIHCIKSAFSFLVFLAISPFTLVYDCFRKKQIKPMRPTSDIPPAEPVWPPPLRGFASSLFQTSGLGTKWSASPPLEGECDWNEWMEDPKHVLHPEGFDYNEFFTDILSDPTEYIRMLRNQNVTSHRFSLEWNVIEPEEGRISPEGVELYRNFIDKLIEANITPTITLSHFTTADWFRRDGGFQKTENIDTFVEFALNAMALFPQVDDWWSFNELGIKAFQQAREVYPTDLPEGSSLSKRVHATGTATGNMLLAHCILHEKVAERYPHKRLGVTHQWLKFDTATGNWLEKLVAYFFTKLSFTPVYKFFKKGAYNFQFPFMANIQLEIPKQQFNDNNHFLMQLGVQTYPKAMIKMGLNRGKTYPGAPAGIKNFPFFSFGASCEPEGTVMRLGARWKAEGIDEALEEAFDLTDNVWITEFGSDACVQRWGNPGFENDEEAQAEYLRQLTDRIHNYSIENSKEIKGIYCWTDLSRFEWNEGHECRMALVNPIVDENRKMTGWTETPGSRHLADFYRPTADREAEHIDLPGTA